MFPSQTPMVRVGPTQAPAVPVSATAALQTGFDINTIMNLMIPMMMIVMMMKMMTGAIGEPKAKLAPVEAS